MRYRCGRRRTSPHQHFALFVDRQLFGLDQFDLQVLDILVIQVKLPLQRAVGDPPFALEPSDRLHHHFRKLHTLFSLPGRSVLAVRLSHSHNTARVTSLPMTDFPTAVAPTREGQVLQNSQTVFAAENDIVYLPPAKSYSFPI